MGIGFGTVVSPSKNRCNSIVIWCLRCFLHRHRPQFIKGWGADLFFGLYHLPNRLFLFGGLFFYLTQGGLMKKIIMFLCATFYTCTIYANTETIRWSVDGTVTTTTCQSGGAVTLPATPPNKRGYTFAGWQEIDPNINGSSYTYDEEDKTWRVIFSYGTISGTALCSITLSSSSTPDESNVGDIRYCWCRITHPVLSHWVFFADFGSSLSCSMVCAERCGYIVRNNYANMRSKLFDSVAP